MKMRAQEIRVVLFEHPYTVGDFKFFGITVNGLNLTLGLGELTAKR